MDYGDAALADAAARTQGMTASFVKELMRRAVLRAALRGEDPGAQHLSGALDDLLDDHDVLTRALLGGGESGLGPFSGGGPGLEPFSG